MRGQPVSWISMVAIAIVVYLNSWNGWFVTDGGYARQWAAGQPPSLIPEAQQFTINFTNNNLLGSANCTNPPPRTARLRAIHAAAVRDRRPCRAMSAAIRNGSASSRGRTDVMQGMRDSRAGFAV